VVRSEREMWASSATWAQVTAGERVRCVSRVGWARGIWGILIKTEHWLTPCVVADHDREAGTCGYRSRVRGRTLKTQAIGCVWD
jgi:hypothetical protein